MQNHFLKEHGATMLTAAGVVGVVSTTVLAVRATPKALDRIESAREEKGEDLTLIEIVKAGAPSYIATIVSAATTIFCIAGSNHLNRRTITQLNVAYTTLLKTYNDHKDAVKEYVSPDGVAKIEEAVNKKAAIRCAAGGEVKDGEAIFVDGTYGFSWISTVDQMEKSIKECLRMYNDDTMFGMADLIYGATGADYFLGSEYGCTIGWNKEMFRQFEGVATADELDPLKIEMELMDYDCGTPVYKLCYNYEPDICADEF